MKSQRQSKILEIISTQDVETQEQLLQALRKDGHYCTQATISRDIKDLRIVKELTNFGTYRYAVPDKKNTGTFSDRLNAIFRECVTQCEYAQNLVVLHTMPGLASAAASAIDSMASAVVLGTLAGDDTVLIVMQDTNAATVFSSEIKNLMT